MARGKGTRWLFIQSQEDINGGLKLRFVSVLIYYGGLLSGQAKGGHIFFRVQYWLIRDAYQVIRGYTEQF